MISSLISLLIAAPLNAEGVIRNRNNTGKISSIGLRLSAADNAYANQANSMDFFVTWDYLNRIGIDDAANDVINQVQLKFRYLYSLDRNKSLNAEVIGLTSSGGEVIPVSGRCQISYKPSNPSIFLSVSCNLKLPRGQVLLRGTQDYVTR